LEIRVRFSWRYCYCSEVVVPLPGDAIRYLPVASAEKASPNKRDLPLESNPILGLWIVPPDADRKRGAFLLIAAEERIERLQ
jgi:hypothetical protein